MIKKISIKTKFGWISAFEDNGKIFKSTEHSERFKKSAELIDFEIPYSVEEIEKANSPHLV